MDQLGAEILRDGFFEAIETQMRDRTPPETKRTFDRLISEGHSRENAMKLIACVLLFEMSRIADEAAEYDEEMYVQGLRALPDLALDD